MNSIKYIICLFICLSFVGNAQTGGYAPFENLNYAPKSPEAAAFLKYGEYPVDLSTGVPNISIPIYTIDIGDFQMPISLDYHASGIQVSQEATWVGLGWNLNVGAQIILSARDGVDENIPTINDVPDANAILAYWESNPFYFNPSGPPGAHLEDSKVKDVYNISSPTVNGNFYIRNAISHDIVVFPPDAFKVEMNCGTPGNPILFRVTDKLGNTYLFTGEKELSVVSMTHSDMYTSTWYASEIQTPKNGKLILKYQDDGAHNEVSVMQNVAVHIDGIMGGQSGCSLNESNSVGTIVEHHPMTTTYAKKISEILFNDGTSRVLFTKVDDRQDLLDSSDNGYLKFVQVQQLNPATNSFVTKKGFDFDYSYFTASTGPPTQRLRLKLNTVTDMITGEETKMTYSSTNLPAKDSKSIDFYGYFNNASNIDLIPPIRLQLNPALYTIGHANRSVNPDWLDACMLTEIQYPSKGKTKFTYEPNTYQGVDEMSVYTEHILDDHLLQGSGTAHVAHQTIETFGPDFTPLCTLPNPNVNPECVQYRVIPFETIDSDATLSFQIFNNGDVPNSEAKHHYARVRILDMGAQEIWTSEPKLATETITHTFHHLNSGVILLEAYGAIMSIKDTQLRYFNHDLVPKNVLTKGLRIKSIESFQNNNDAEPVLAKRYSYTDGNGKSSGMLANNGLSSSFITPSTTSYNFHICPENCPTCSAVDYHTTYNVQSFTRGGIEGNTVVYKYVREESYDRDGNINGYTQYEFNVCPDEQPLGTSTVAVQTNWKRGKLINKSEYRTIDGLTELVHSEANTYKEDSRKTVFYSGFKSFNHRLLGFFVTGNNIQLTPFQYQVFRSSFGIPYNASEINEVMQINIPILWYYQDSSVSTDYFYDATHHLSGTLEKTTNYFFDNPDHLQLTRTETSGSDGRFHKAISYYPGDLLSEPFMPYLVSKNRIAEVIKSEEYLDDEPLSARNTMYNDWGNNIVAPEIIQSSKGNRPLEKRMIYNLRNDRGNPLQVQMVDGMVTSYIWGYNGTKVVAKIENKKYYDIDPQLRNHLIGTSDFDLESNVISSLNELRVAPGMSDAMVSGFTYIPLIGVSTIIDPKGQKSVYQYDAQGRLAMVRDTDGHILSKNEYHYRAQ